MKIFTFIFLSAVIYTADSFGQENTNPKDTLKYEMEQITVSATRYPEEILEVPYAVTVITGDKFTDVKGYGLDEVLSSVPGVLAQSRSGNQDVRLVIRGFGARGSGDRSNSGTSRGIRVMVDGIPETEPDGRTSFDNVDLNSAETIEVIRSNASAVWGNAAGGIVNISSVPYFVSPFADFRIQGGSYDFQKYAVKTGTLIGTGKLYGSFAYTTFGGWREHSDSRRSVLNIGLLSDLTPATHLGVFVTGSNNKFNIPGPLTEDQFYSNPSMANPFYLERKERRYNRLFRIGATFDHTIDDIHSVSGMLFVNPKFLQRSERNSFRDFTRYHLGGNVVYHNRYDLSESLQSILSAGVDEAYQDGAILFYSLSPEKNRGDELTTDKREGANSMGAFLQEELIINEKFSLIAGARYDNITYYSEDFLDPALGLQEKTFDHITPKAGLTYRFSQFQSVYANVGGGVEVPAGNETDPAGTYGQDSVYLINPLLEPILSTTYELGTKHFMMLDQEDLLQSFSYDLALYYITVKNDIVPYSGGRFYFTAGETRRMGIEVGTDFNLNYGLSLQATLTWSLNKYVDYIVDSAHYNNAGKFADYAENKVAGIPDVFYNAGITYSPEFFDRVYISFDVNGIGEYFADDANKISVPAYHIFNASIGTRKLELGDVMSLRGAITFNNITDELYAASSFINPDKVDGQPVYLEPGLPGNITASLTLGF
jgi:iron complex outermembrane receptor protein